MLSSLSELKFSEEEIPMGCGREAEGSVFGVKNVRTEGVELNLFSLNCIR